MNGLGKYGGIIAIEPNLDVGLAYKNLFFDKIKIYRDKDTFVKAHDSRQLDVGFPYDYPIIFIMETAFAQNLDHRLDDTPHRNNYPSKPAHNYSEQEILRKSLNQDIGIILANEIRNGRYTFVKTNAPIIFTTWTSNDAAKKEILKIPYTGYIQKTSNNVGNIVTTDTEALCYKIQRELEKIILIR